MADQDIVQSPVKEPIDVHRLLLAAPVAVAAAHDADSVVHNLETGVTYRLNDIGARIWESLETGSTIAAITDMLRTEYRLPDDVVPEQVQNDVSTIVAQLHEYGLITVQDT